jgi:ABC-type transport system involved in multi-copper enzyme maturation permease subunit
MSQIGGIKMFWHIAQKEFLSNILSLRFSVAFLLAFILIVISAYVLTSDYGHQVEDYSARVMAQEDWFAQYAHSNRMGTIIDQTPEPPTVLSALFRGIPQDADVESFDQSPMPALFPLMDWLFIVGVVMSLLALVFSYDAICGEREDGTLRLTMSYPVSRSIVLLSKWTGGFLSLLMPFVTAWFAGLHIVNINPDIHLSGKDFGVIGLVFLVSLLYISAFFALGILISTRTRSAATAIMTALFVWVIFALGIPNLSPYVAAQIHPTPSIAALEHKINAIWEDADMVKSNTWRELRAKGLKEAEYEKAGMEVVNRVNREVHENVGKLRGDFQRKADRQTNIALEISCLSPLPVFMYASTDLAGVERHSKAHFSEAAGRYASSFWDYFNAKWKKLKSENPSLGFESKLDLSDRPRFRYQEESIKDRINATLPYIALLFLFNFIFFMSGYISFLRYDVR